MNDMTKIAERPAGDGAAEDRVLKLKVIDHDGQEHLLDGLEGWRVMEIIRDWGVGIKAECGGSCACGSCHVFVDPAWADLLVPATGEEMDQLDQIYESEANSRLSCQILMRPDLDGLTVRLAPGSEPG